MLRRKGQQKAPAPDAPSPGAGEILLLEPLLAVHSAASIAWLVDTTASAAERGLGALYAYLFLTDAAGRLVGQPPASDERLRSLVRVQQALGADLAALKFSPAERPAVASVLQERRVAVVHDLAEALPATVTAEQAREAQRRLAVAEAWLAPLHWGGESLGLLLLFMPANPAARPELAELLGRHVAVALTNLRKEEAGRRRGELDAVRWVYDEQRFLQQLTQEVRRARRYQRPLSMLLVCIQNLKDLRARYGRFLAERALRQLAGHLSDQIRTTDFLAAFRDDGLACILVESDAEGAQKARQRLLGAVASGQPFASLPDAKVELACATATLLDDGETAEQLISAAAARLSGEDKRAEQQVA